jgi:integrase/recombinase XerD
VKRLLAKAGLARQSSGAHLFRHTVATQLVKRGASFKDVVDALGHHHTLQTTGLYAKLDLTALAQVALPWPGGARCAMNVHELHTRLDAYLALREALG